MSTNKMILAQSWSQIAPDFDQIGPPFFGETGRRLAEIIYVGDGASVLDVAAGRGAVLFPAAENLEGHGRAIGIDLAYGMLKNMAADPRINGQPINLIQMDGEHLAFAGATFDAVLCGHAIFYFSQAIGEFRRVLRSGGQLGLTIVAAGTFDWLWQLFEPYQEQEDSSPEAEPAIDTPEGLHWRLAWADFVQIQVWQETAVFIYPDEETWWNNLWALGTRRILETMSPSEQQKFKQELFQQLQRFKQPDGVHIPICTIFATASKPEMPNG